MLPPHTAAIASDPTIAKNRRSKKPRDADKG
jgi:hypothetical protein